jgi:hypothetical protein
MKANGAKLMVIRDAHDYLIERGIVPDYALSVDPLPTAADCFKSPHLSVEYLISAQSDDVMFDFLKAANVTVWYPYITDGQREPKNKMLIGGATTSGLRGIVVAYVLGYRDFHIFGMDSCLSGDALRVNGTKAKEDDQIVDVRLERDGPVFYCNTAMALQAQNFQDIYEQLPGATFKGYGEGLIQSMILENARRARWLATLEPIPDNGRVSFIHRGGPSMASFRYRASLPAAEMNASVNDLTASTLVFAKPQSEELIEMAEAKTRGQWVVVDFCDDHFTWPHYQEALRLADAVTCATPAMAEIIRTQRRYAREASIVPDPYEFVEQRPHFSGLHLLWFGHSVNRPSLDRIMPDLAGYPLRTVSNFEGSIQWNLEQMPDHFAWADIVLLPATDGYRSPNRAIEAIRQGCFVVAEPHPAINDFPGIYIGNIKEGLEWVKRQPLRQINRSISTAQKYVRDAYAPSTVASAWKSAIQRPTTLEADATLGPDGSMLTAQMMQT